MKTGNFYQQKLDQCNYDEKLQKCIKDTCEYCITNTFGADEEKKKQPIMMLGKIQSGKTRAFIGLIALAFDNDFDMVFILTKNSKALIQQTESRMKQEFKKFVKDNEVFITNIMRTNSRIRGYQLEKKNIVIAKKQKDNLSKVIKFIEDYSINQNKKCLVIDDEADTTGIGYSKEKGSDEFDLRMVASKVDEIRGTLDGCVFVQVTATPYALYLQPEFNEDDEPKPIKPIKTILVPFSKEYIGGDYYFLKSKEEGHPAQFLFEPMSEDEHSLVSVQRRKGKKSKIDDRRSLKEEKILTSEDKLPIFKRGIINFIVGGIVLREIYKANSHYAYVIHTATQTGSHVSLQGIAETFLEQIRDRNKNTQMFVERLLKQSFDDIQQSVLAYNLNMPTFNIIQNKFYDAIDREYYSIDVVNSDNQVEVLLDEDTGELNLSTPFSIFVGGQVLDRGVTIPNMIGFYYGRNPRTMQQDTVLQHSRMFGYRKELLPVTRFYTTQRIHSNMEKITEIDMALREDIDNGRQGDGVYFITHKDQNKEFEKGRIKPCSPDKIRVSDIILLKPHRYVLPIGFTPVNKTIYTKIDKEIEEILQDAGNTQDYFKAQFKVEEVEKLIRLAYATIEKDDGSERFIPVEEFITTLKYMCGDANALNIVVKKNKDTAKLRKKGRIQDTPVTGDMEGIEAKKMAIDTPSVILLQENGNDKDWKYRSFWWPILVSPQNVPKTIYASKVAGEKVINKLK